MDIGFVGREEDRSAGDGISTGAAGLFAVGRVCDSAGRNERPPPAG